MPLVKARKSSSICAASSRVGVMIRTSFLPSVFSSLLMIGRMNAAVLPVPVLARPMHVAAFHDRLDRLVLDLRGGFVASAR